MDLYYAGIGSRETPQEFLNLFRDLAAVLESRGWVLRSGGADGADIAFESGVVEPANKQIFIPWNGFNRSLYGWVPFEDNITLYKKAEAIAADAHPAWHRCNHTVRGFHIRNVAQVLGPDLKTHSTMVICWTKDGKGQGGTGQAIRIAREHQIPVFDFGSEPEFVEKQLEQFVVDSEAAFLGQGLTA